MFGAKNSLNGHRLSSWPGSSQPSTPSGARNKDVDTRDKPAQDDLNAILPDYKQALIVVIIFLDNPALAGEG
jgi:hypothetical protein